MSNLGPQTGAACYLVLGCLLHPSNLIASSCASYTPGQVLTQPCMGPHYSPQAEPALKSSGCGLPVTHDLSGLSCLPAPRNLSHQHAQYPAPNYFWSCPVLAYSKLLIPKAHWITDKQHKLISLTVLEGGKPVIEGRTLDGLLVTAR